MKKCGVETFTASLLEPTFETLDTTLNQKVGTRDPFQQLKRTKTIVQVSVEKIESYAGRMDKRRRRIA